MTFAVPARVLVTGAAGFMGQAVAQRYRELGAEVVGVDLRGDPEHGIAAGTTVDPAPWACLLDGCDLVVHTAAIVSFEGDPARFWTSNVLGTRRVLDAAARAGVARFVHISSVTAFGFEFPDGVDERWPVRTNGSPYVDTKVAGEQVVLQAHAAGEIPCTIVRPGDVYGPRSRPWTILPVEIIRARRMVLPARGRGVFSPVYIDDLVDGIVAAAASPAASGHVFTVTDGVGVSTRDFFGRYSRLLGLGRPPGVPTRVAKGLARLAGAVDRARGVGTEATPTSVAYLARRGTYSIAKAHAVLGYEPKIDLDEGMTRTAMWLAEAGYLDPKPARVRRVATT